MPLDADKFLVPDGAPSAGVQPMKSVSFGELAGVMGNENYKFPVTDGIDGEVITTDGLGVSTFKDVPRASSLSYRFNTSTSAPPASGQIRVNDIIQDDATLMWMNDVTFNGTDVSAFLTETIGAGSIVRIQRQEDAGQFKDYDVVSNTDEGGYHELTVTFRASGGSAFGNNNNLLMVVLSGVSSSSQFNTVTTGETLTKQVISSRVFDCDASGGAFTITLPPASDIKGLTYVFTKSDTSLNKITIDGNGAELIGGNATVEVLGFRDSVIIISDGTGWVFLSTEVRQVTVLVDRNGEAQQSIPSGVSTQIELNQEVIDSGGYYNPVSFTWTPQPGIYLIHAHIKLIQLDSNDEVDIRIMKNGSAIYFENKFATMNNQDVTSGASGLTSANGTDVYTIEIEHNQGNALNLSSSPNETYFYGYRIG